MCVALTAGMQLRQQPAGALNLQQKAKDAVVNVDGFLVKDEIAGKIDLVVVSGVKGE